LSIMVVVPHDPELQFPMILISSIYIVV